MAEKQALVSKEEIFGFKSQTDEENVTPAFGFDMKTEKSDLVIIVQDKPLYVKRSVLEDASPVFEKIFEEKLDSNKELHVEGTSYGDFAEFLACVQPRNRRRITTSNVLRMLDLAEQYQVDNLKERCEECLLNTLLTVQLQTKSIVILLSYSHDFGLEDLKELCLVKGRERPIEEIFDENSLRYLSSDVKCNLYEEFIPALSAKSQKADFLTTAFSKEEQISLEEFVDAKHFKITFVCLEKQRHFYKFCHYDVNWTVEVVFPICGESDFPGWIHLLCDNESVKKRFHSHVGVSYSIRNHLSSQDNRCRRHYFLFESWQSSNFSSRMWFQEGDIGDENLGFKINEKFTIDVHFLINRPVFL